MPPSEAAAPRHLRLLEPLLSILFLSSLPPSKPQQTNAYFQYRNCAPTPYQCGSLHFDIGYPFSVNGVDRPDYCSSPGYRLSCTNTGKLVIATNNPAGLFQVTSVDYDNHLLTVIDQSLADQTCLQPYRNTTIDHAMFAYTDRDRFLTVYVNCSAASSPPFPFAYDLFSCLSGGRSYYRLDNGTAAPDVLMSCSSTLVLPYNATMADSLAAGNSSLGDAVRGGFTLRWQAGTGWCGDCKNSGGYCGNNNTCFCPDGQSARSCSSSGMFCF